MHYRSMFSGVSPQIVLSGPSEKWRKEKAMDTVDQSLPKRMVESAISGLRPRTRNVVELIHLQEHSITETPQILGISSGAVKSRMFHAKIALHRMPLLQSVGSSNCARQAE